MFEAGFGVIREKDAGLHSFRAYCVGFGVQHYMITSLKSGPFLVGFLIITRPLLFHGIWGP